MKQQRELSYITLSISTFLNLAVRLLPLLCRLELVDDCLNLDLVDRCSEGGIEGERIGFADISTFWEFGQDFPFGTSEGLEGSLEFARDHVGGI